jgi:transcriptional regulator with XRE-family HTH domain
VDEGQTLGGRLQNARERQGLSISDVAKLSGVQKKTLMNWELDRSEPRSNRLIQLAGVLGVQAAFLLDGQGGDAPLPHRSKDEVKTALADMEAQLETLARDVLRIGDEIQQVTTQITRLRQSDW